MARYKIEDIGGWRLGDKVEEGSPAVRAWWRISNGKGKVGSIFKEKLRMLVRKGDKTLFWMDHWVGERPLKDVFPRLFRISSNRHATVQDCYAI